MNESTRETLKAIAEVRAELRDAFRGGNKIKAADAGDRLMALYASLNVEGLLSETSETYTLQDAA